MALADLFGFDANDLYDRFQQYQQPSVAQPTSGISGQTSQPPTTAVSRSGPVPTAPAPTPTWSTQPQPRTTEPTAASAAQAYTGGSFQDWFMGQLSGKPFNQQTLLDLEPLLQQSGSRLTPANSLGERTKIWDPTRNDWVRVGFGEGTPQWIYQGWGMNGPQAQAPQGGGVFNDPATQEWESLLRTINQRLQQPQPTYTDAQRDLMQTQAIDPLERQRQTQKANTQQRFAARGIAPGSGILEQALQDVDRQFDQMKTGQQSQFALNQIGREDQLFNNNEQRALAGLNLFSQIPQLADRRLQMAQGSLIPSNPYQLLNLQNQIAQQGQQQQNFNQQQDQQFWAMLGQLLANSFGGR
jgi:hypothetical protein